MFRVKEENKKKYLKLFNEYDHSIPIIYSNLEGQYPGVLYVDDEVNPNYGMLLTPFGFHYFIGKNELVDIFDLKDTFFDYLKENNEKEAIVFGPTKEWYKTLDLVFEGIKVITDVRKVFSLDKEDFYKVKNSLNIPEDVKLVLEDKKEANATSPHFLSTMPYPVARLFKNDECVSLCSAFMIGKSEAELDITTKEEYRGKGYGKIVAITLIDTLLNRNLTPNWSTWPYRIISQKLALRIGFKPIDDINAYIIIDF